MKHHFATESAMFFSRRSSPGCFLVRTPGPRVPREAPRACCASSACSACCAWWASSACCGWSAWRRCANVAGSVKREGVRWWVNMGIVWVYIYIYVYNIMYSIVKPNRQRSNFCRCVFFLEQDEGQKHSRSHMKC